MRKTSILPNYVDFDLGENKTISGWKLLNAGQESQSWITSDCFLQVKNAVNEEWKTVDGIFGNSSNEVSRNLSRYSGYYYASTTFEYATVMLYGLSFQKVLL